MYARGKFGIEYTPPEPKPDRPGLGRVVVVIALVAALLVIRAVWKRIVARPADGQDIEIVALPPVDNVNTNAVSQSSATDSPEPTTVRVADYANRPVKVRNLLLRLKEAEGRQDVEMAISTIEQLRATPGTADLDDQLARRLGALNMRRLFELKSAQWTVEVKAKRGDTATRIAYEHGSTFSSLVKLNGGPIDKLNVGQKLTVMNHPRFNLVITRRTRTADLSLNGKFFKRYYLTDEVGGAEGSYATSARFREFCTEKGVPFRPLDRAELEMLLPKGTAVYIKDI